jgi:hypothetical protein
MLGGGRRGPERVAIQVAQSSHQIRFAFGAGQPVFRVGGSFGVEPVPSFGARRVDNAGFGSDRIGGVSGHIAVG